MKYLRSTVSKSATVVGDYSYISRFNLVAEVGFLAGKISVEDGK